jgi:hypothetical protein
MFKHASEIHVTDPFLDPHGAQLTERRQTLLSRDTWACDLPGGQARRKIAEKRIHALLCRLSGGTKRSAGFQYTEFPHACGEAFEMCWSTSFIKMKILV